MSTKDTPAFNPAQFLRVPDVASLQGPVIDTAPVASLKEGQPVWVDSLRTYWRFSALRALVADGITVENNLTAGQFLRDEGYQDETWLAQQLWYIDGAAGDDEADGLTPATALLTYAELVRRLGKIFSPKSGNTVYIEVLSVPTDVLSWELQWAGSDAAAPSVIILAPRNETPAVLSLIAVPVGPLGDIGDVSVVAAGYFAYQKIYRHRNQDTFFVLSENRPPNNASICASEERTGTTLAVAPSPVGGDTIFSFDPIDLKIRSLVSRKVNVIVQGGLISNAVLDSVSFLGCRLQSCSTNSIITRACVIDGGYHAGEQTTIATLHRAAPSSPILDGVFTMGESLGNGVVGSFVNRGMLSITNCAITLATAMLQTGICAFLGPFQGDALFGGIINAIPTNTGAITLGPGSQTYQEAFGGPSIECQSPNNLLFTQTATVCQEPVAALSAPCSNLGSGAGGLMAAPFSGVMIELKSRASFTSLS